VVANTFRLALKPNIQEKLLTAPDSTLAQLRSIAIGIESTVAMTLSSVSAFHEINHPHPRPNHRFNRPNSQFEGYCLRCNKYGHKAMECRASLPRIPSNPPARFQTQANHYQPRPNHYQPRPRHHKPPCQDQTHSQPPPNYQSQNYNKTINATQAVQSEPSNTFNSPQSATIDSGPKSLYTFEVDFDADYSHSATIADNDCETFTFEITPVAVQPVEQLELGVVNHAAIEPNCESVANDVVDQADVVGDSINPIDLIDIVEESDLVVECKSVDRAVVGTVVYPAWQTAFVTEAVNVGPIVLREMNEAKTKTKTNLLTNPSLNGAVAKKAKVRACTQMPINHFTLTLITLLSLIAVVQAINLMLCRTTSKPTAKFKIPEIPVCTTPEFQIYHEPVPLNLPLFKPNSILYHTFAHLCKVIESVLPTYSGLLGNVKTDKQSCKNSGLGVKEPYSMTQWHTSVIRDIAEVDTVHYTNNAVDPEFDSKPYSSCYYLIQDTKRRFTPIMYSV
jgi:hypothetical protein